MSNATRVEPEQVLELMEQGHVFVDVRSQPEFAAGHVPGAYNVPLALATAGGMEPNPDFVRVVQRHFAPDQPLILGCRAGGRSARAAELLAEAGYSKLSDMSVGWVGQRDAFGRLVPGWEGRSLPTEIGQPDDRRYGALSG